MNEFKPRSPEPAQWYRRWSSRALSWRAYLRGILLVCLGSRWASPINFLLTGAVALLGASGEFGLLEGGRYVLVFLALVALQQGWATAMQGSGIAAFQESLGRLSAIISSIAGGRRDDETLIIDNPTQTIEALLRRGKEIAQASLKLPAGERITVNVLVPEKQGGKIQHLRVVHCDDFYPDRRHDPIPLDAPGAPEAFLRGTPVAVPYTEHAGHPRVRGRPYKSVAAFPVIVGEPANDGRVAAVVSLDSTKPYSFEEKDVAKLTPVLMPIVQLVGLTLELRREREEQDEEAAGEADAGSA